MISDKLRRFLFFFVIAMWRVTFARKCEACKGHELGESFLYFKGEEDSGNVINKLFRDKVEISIIE